MLSPPTLPLRCFCNSHLLYVLIHWWPTLFVNTRSLLHSPALVYFTFTWIVPFKRNMQPRPQGFSFKKMHGWGGKRHFVKLLTKFNFFFELFLLIEGAFVSSYGIRTKNTQCSCNSHLLRLLEQWNAESIVLYLTSSRFR